LGLGAKLKRARLPWAAALGPAGNDQPVSRSGADLALLLLGGFRFRADEAKEKLAARGHPAFGQLTTSNCAQ